MRSVFNYKYYQVSVTKNYSWYEITRTCKEIYVQFNDKPQISYVKGLLKQVKQLDKLN